MSHAAKDPYGVSARTHRRIVCIISSHINTHAHVKSKPPAYNSRCASRVVFVYNSLLHFYNVVFGAAVRATSGLACSLCYYRVFNHIILMWGVLWLSGLYVVFVCECVRLAAVCLFALVFAPPCARTAQSTRGSHSRCVSFSSVTSCSRVYLICCPQSRW